MRKLVLAAAGASLALALLELALFDLPPLKMALVFFATACVPPAALVAYAGYQAERRVRDIEEALPSALFQVASLPKGANIEKAIAAIAASDYGLLSNEFAKANRRVNAGASVPRALELMARENGSALLGRACWLLSNAYANGGDQSNAFKEVAEDAFQMQALGRENAASLAVQKYTLLIASAALVPFILAVLLSVVNSLNGSFAASGGLFYSSASAAQRSALLDAVTLGSQAYLAAFALLACWFAASFEGAPKKFIAYAALCLPCALAIFELVRSATIA
ncbi:hypothetical protein COX86_02290 [Candidatus Micrarchaeota archaeon CG_4_10_14_0_2_um_filter_60_11]|nr:MAG: hypothetical protein AUJ16_02840 [Candidatus Micrarchaeota archaeon CG1_02_60_51]PIN95884.1 MAG: hypothetical protein COU39_03535 [Candidatus Micrarchaeota archaeon CG10_big_fil_rev_8_21_14_0_10_60_32]PIO01913.1 MAG: hypothetical protein COT58_02620 [Candidatus Micrarchaeota archaeon CG09_land_8_20_14_0_10_60_16]PIY91892.1 MAG: hypothetical protein COY71_00705 [Candidatus Micrarchaeota archaeon CG_4_10_14_0_8_um_filter_60_7]PIZ90948.1 MAG: hypothetical protein COX86_02290 [Candidatus Mi